MENIEIPTGTLIPRSALRKLQPHELQPSADPLPRVSLLKAYWNSIEVNANTTPEASLRSRFISALKSDPLSQNYRDNPPNRWSWQDGLLLHDNLVYVPHDDALCVELMRTHHDDPLAGHYGVAKTFELLSRNYYFPGMY